MQKAYSTWTLAAIARRIAILWDDAASLDARPWLDAMTRCGRDDLELIRHFLARARAWKGHDANVIKAELRRRIR